MWYAEITVGAKHDLPDQLSRELNNRLTGDQNHAENLKDTIHKDSAFILKDVLYSFRDVSIVYFITKSDAKTLSVHIERMNKKSPLRELKSTVQEVISRLERFLKHHKNSISRVEGEILVNGNAELSCIRRPLKSRLKDGFKTNLLSKAYVPVATVAASQLLGTDLKRSVFNAAVALIALLIWVLIEAFISERYAFREV